MNLIDLHQTGASASSRAGKASTKKGYWVRRQREEFEFVDLTISSSWCVLGKKKTGPNTRRKTRRQPKVKKIPTKKHWFPLFSLTALGRGRRRRSTTDVFAAVSVSLFDFFWPSFIFLLFVFRFSISTIYCRRGARLVFAAASPISRAVHTHARSRFLTGRLLIGWLQPYFLLQRLARSSPMMTMSSFSLLLNCSFACSQREDFITTSLHPQTHTSTGTTWLEVEIVSLTFSSMAFMILDLLQVATSDKRQVFTRQKDTDIYISIYCVVYILMSEFNRLLNQLKL